MHSRNDPSTKIANDRSLSSCQRVEAQRVAQRKRPPAAFGGVCGSASEKRPITTDAPAASCIGSASASALSTLPTMMPAAIQPIVPSTRIIGKSRAGFSTW